MAATVTLTRSDAFGAGKVAFVTVRGDSSYPTGGEAINFATAANGGITTVSHVFCGPVEDVNGTPIAATTAVMAHWDYANALLVLKKDINQSYIQEVSNGANANAIYVKMMVVGV